MFTEHLAQECSLLLIHNSPNSKQRDVSQGHGQTNRGIFLQHNMTQQKREGERLKQAGACMNPHRNVSDGQDSKTPLCALKPQEKEQSQCRGEVSQDRG